MNETHDNAVTVSVIIISYNTRQMTLDCLRSLYEHMGGVAAEVLVVDNASADESAEAIRREFSNVELIANAKNVGFGAANNQAMRRARGEYFLLLNSDAFLKDGALPALIEFLRKNPEVAIVGPRLLNADGSVQHSYYHFPSPLRCWTENFGITGLFSWHPVLGNYRRLDMAKDHDVDFVIGACILVRREMYRQVGGFDEQFFMYQEEADWQKRAWLKGWRVAFTPTAEAIHLGGGSGKDEPVKINQVFFESLDRYELKHHGIVGFLLMRAAMLLGCALRIGWWSLAALAPATRERARHRLQLLSWLILRQASKGLPAASSL